MSRLIVIGCGAAKLDHPAPARDLYVGGLFRAARRYAEESGHPWRILSARYGLVEPSAILAPYEHRLEYAERYAQAQRVRSQLVERYEVVEVHAGNLYAIVLEMALPMDVHIEKPLDGLGIGQRRHWYAERRK